MISAYSDKSQPYSLASSSTSSAHGVPCPSQTQLTLASKRIKRSFRFLSKTPILTLKNPASFPLSFLGDPLPLALPLASGLPSPRPGAPNTLGSLKGDEAGIVGTGDVGRCVCLFLVGDKNDAALLGGEFDHDGFMFSGSIVGMYEYSRLRLG